MACLGQWSPPHPAIFHVAFLGQLPLACGLGAFWGSGLWWPELSQRLSNVKRAPGFWGV